MIDRRRKTDREREKGGLLRRGDRMTLNKLLNISPACQGAFRQIWHVWRLPRGYRPNTPIHADLYEVSELVPESWNHLESSGNLQWPKLSFYTPLP